MPDKDLNMGMLFKHSDSNPKEVPHTGMVFERHYSIPGQDWYFEDTYQHNLMSFIGNTESGGTREFRKW